MMPHTRTGAEYHSAAAAHHEEAARHHRKAAAYYEEREYAFAAHEAVIAYGHTRHAVQQAHEAGKFHAERYSKEMPK